MKKILYHLLLAVAVCALINADALAQGIPVPRTASPGAEVAQSIGISTVRITYSRPAVKGRAVWGSVVPYGWTKGNGRDIPWRAGANENTVVEFSHDAKVAGKAVPAGKYGLFYVVNEDGSAEAILSKDHRSWGSFHYDAARDQLRTKIQTRAIPHTELLTYDFINLSKNGAELVLNWEKKQIVLPIEFAVDDIVMANAAEELKGPTGFTWQGFASAADYALQNKVNLETANNWIDRAVAQNKNFNTLNTKAGLLRLTGKTAEADKMQNEAMTLATEAELNAYGYQLAGEQRYDEAIKVMKLNTERHPQSANAWDSLGEVYALKGDKNNAITNFKKALSLNPPANVRANSEKYLKQLGGM
jgi:tetratricopeptide (TPR) repeat protein